MRTSSQIHYIDKVIADCNSAKTATSKKPNVVITKPSDIGKLDGIGNAIYIIEDLGNNVQKTFDTFSKFKNKQKIKGGRKCSRLNKHGAKKIMYVGSSKDLKKRIKEHMGYGNSSVYALHLKHSLKGKGKYKITIKEYNVSRDVLYILEAALWHELKPAFGKSGRN